MLIPHADHARVEIKKLRDYTLNPVHRIGKHKARLFAALLGIKLEDADELRRILLQAVLTQDAELGERDTHGQKYRVDFMLTRFNKRAWIRSVWIVRPNENFPRLVTCYPLKEAE